MLEVEDLTVHYFTTKGVVRAVEDVSFKAGRGEWLTFVGESGSGKSTVAHALINLISPPGRIVKGRILLEGRNILEMSKEELRKIRGREVGMVFQDPMTSLDPLRKIGDQMVEAMTEHGVDEDEARKVAGDLLEKVNVPKDRLDYYPHQLSGGQRQRVAIAIAMSLRPKLLIADEPTTALDVIVQKAIMELLEELKKEKTSILFVTHDVSLAVERSDRMAVMYAGKLVEVGSVERLLDPIHPYLKALLESVPDLYSDRKIKPIPGHPPDLRNPPEGCRFHPRCPFAMEICRKEEPELKEVEKGHFVACHLVG